MKVQSGLYEVHQPRCAKSFAPSVFQANDDGDLVGDAQFYRIILRGSGKPILM
jgi:hypothetical protein